MRAFDDPHRLQDLLERLKETLPGLPGFQSLSIFGSIPEGRSDGYSDIDLIVTTDDVDGAKASVLGVLEHVGPIEFCWAIYLRPDEWNPMVVFRDEGYYHKLDLGIADSSAVNRTIPPEQTTLLIEKWDTALIAPMECRGYVPPEGSIGHFLLGQFIGCSRYAKSRSRGQGMSCYRFAAAAVDWRLALRYACLTGDPSRRSKLSTVDYRNLDELLSPEDRDALLYAIDLSNLRAMDRTLLATMCAMLKDARHLADSVDEALPTDVFERIIDFVRDELREV